MLLSPDALLRWRGLFILARLLGLHKRETSNFLPGAAGFTMAIVRQFRPILDGSCCANTIVTALLTASKIHRIPFQEAGAFNPALSIADFAAPGFWLFLPSFTREDFWSGIVSAGLNTPAYWDGIKLIFGMADSAVTIVFAQLKPSQIGRNFA